MTVHRFALATALLLAAATPAAADDLAGEQYVFDLGAGVMAKPEYWGADAMKASPFPLISVENFYLPGLGQVLDSRNPKGAFSIYPAFDFISSRDGSGDLSGMEDVDWALELGLGAAYRQDFFKAFVELRQGFNGHHGQEAELGLDLIANPTEDLEVTAGPRVVWASGDVMDTYFSVSTAEAAASGFSAYEAGAGFRSAGIAASAAYALTDTMTLHLRGGWDRLIGDAADSPIVEDGSADQFYAGAGLSYRFGFSLD